MEENKDILVEIRDNIKSLQNEIRLLRIQLEHEERVISIDSIKEKIRNNKNNGPRSIV